MAPVWGRSAARRPTPAAEPSSPSSLRPPPLVAHSVRDATPDETTFFATLRHPRSGERLCSGALLSPQVVLAAVSCFPDAPDTPGEADPSFLPTVEVGASCDGCTPVAVAATRAWGPAPGSQMALLLLDAAVAPLATLALPGGNLPELLQRSPLVALVSGPNGSIRAAELSKLLSAPAVCGPLPGPSDRCARVQAACTADAGGPLLANTRLVGLVTGCDSNQLSLELLTNNTLALAELAVQPTPHPAPPLRPRPFLLVCMPDNCNSNQLIEYCGKPTLR